MRLEDAIRQAVEKMDIPMFIIDTDLRIVFANAGFRRLIASQIPPEQTILGVSLPDISPSIAAQLRALYGGVFRSGQQAHEERTYDVDGTITHIRVNRIPLFDEDRVVYVGSVFSDITDLKNTRDALQRSEETARALMNASTETMILVESDGTIITLNDTAAARLGGTPDQLIGKSGAETLPDDVWRRRKAHYDRVIETGQPVRFTDERGGRVFDISMSPAAGTDRAKRIAIFAQDITEREQSIRALRESEERFRRGFQCNPVPTYLWERVANDFILKDFNNSAAVATQGGAARVLGYSAKTLYFDRLDIVDDMETCFREQSLVQREGTYPIKSLGVERFMQIHYAYVPPTYVLVNAVDLTERRAIEQQLKESHAQLEQRVAERTCELAELNDQLRVEREALDQKNIALRELLAQFNDTRDDLSKQIRINLQRVTLPLLDRLDQKATPALRENLRLLRSSIDDILSPYLAGLQAQHPQLTPLEIDLCNLIRSGMSSKEIAALRSRSVLTIQKQRKTIRRKLGLTDESIDLRSYLLSHGE